MSVAKEIASTLNGGNNMTSMARKTCLFVGMTGMWVVGIVATASRTSIAVDCDFGCGTWQCHSISAGNNDAIWYQSSCRKSGFLCDKDDTNNCYVGGTCLGSTRIQYKFATCGHVCPLIAWPPSMGIGCEVTGDWQPAAECCNNCQQSSSS